MLIEVCSKFQMINNDPYRLLHQWNIRHDKNLSAILKEKGIEAVKGSWSGFEINQLEENMKLYKEMNPEVEIYKVFYDRGSWPNRMILRETRFWDLLSFNLCRSLANIQSHITYLYQSKAGFKKGRYSKEEKAYLKELVKIHGKNWSLISNLMNREPTNLSITFHVHIKNHINKGSWHDEEKTRFFCIAERLMQYNKRNQLTIPKLNWSIVSDFVRTRNQGSCQNFAKKNRLVLENMFSDSSFTPLMKQAMIVYIYFSNVSSKTEINLQEMVLLYNGKFNEFYLNTMFKNLMLEISNNEESALQSLFENEVIDSTILFRRINFENIMQYRMSKPRSIAYLKAKYFLLVNENVQNFTDKPAEEIITFLYDKYCLKNSPVQEHITDNHEEASGQIIDLVNLADDDNDSINLTYLCDNDLIDLTYISDDDESDEMFCDEDEVMIID